MKLRRKELGLSAEYVAEKLGVSPATIYRYEKGDIEKMPGNILAPIARILSTTPAYLMGWDTEDSPAPPPGFQAMPAMAAATPLIGDIACGTPILAEENISRYLPTPLHWHADFALLCRGDSMAPRILDGDLVAIRKVPQVENGQIAAVRIDDEATLKRCYRYPDRLVLQAENPAYEPIVLIGPEMSRATIEGIAVGFMRNL